MTECAGIPHPRDSDDPDPAATKRAAWIRSHLDEAPPLSAAQQELIRRVLTPHLTTRQRTEKPSTTAT